MDMLTLNLNKDALLDLMKNFYLLTNIKIALFDLDGYEILSYPKEHCAFCAKIRSYKKGNANCMQSNRNSFARCQQTQTLEIFHCHAGLLETTAPLIDNGQIIGYIMIGQFTENPDHDKLISSLRLYLHSYTSHTFCDSDPIFNMVYKSSEQIQATVRILEACTLYVLFRDMVSLQRQNFVQNLDCFLLAHLAEDLSIERLTKEFHISKNKLYESCNKYMQNGIAEHIRGLRLAEAKQLLKETTLSVHEISDRVGFNDYNYFCRIFKKYFGTSAGKYRKEQSNYHSNFLAK